MACTYYIVHFENVNSHVGGYPWSIDETNNNGKYIPPHHMLILYNAWHLSMQHMVFYLLDQITIK